MIDRIVNLAFRWARRSEDRERGALATVGVGMQNQVPTAILDGVGSDNGAPSNSTDGIDVEGFGEVQLFYRHATSGNTSTARIFLYDGTEWWDTGTDVDLALDEGVLDPYDLRGLWSRLYLQLTTPPAATVTVKAFPHNE